MGELGLLSSDDTCLFCSVRLEGFLMEPNSLATEAVWLWAAEFTLDDWGDLGELGEDTTGEEGGGGRGRGREGDYSLTQVQAVHMHVEAT